MWNPHRISPAAGVRRYPHRSPPAKCLFYCAISAVFGWLPEGVASQKSGPVASDVPRFARQHTFSARKEPYNQWLGESGVDPAPAGPRFGLWGPPRHPSRDRLRGRSPTRASPEYIQFIPSGDGFCLSENCPADTFPWDAQGYAPPASSITRCFDRFRLNRRLLRVSAMTEIPNCQC